MEKLSGYKLYYVEGTASMGVRVLLEEIGVPYELISTTTIRGKPRPSEQLRINPNGWIPVLVWDDGAMYECAAIIIFLCDRHQAAQLAPKPNSPLRSLFLQTLVYFSSSIQTAFQQDYHPYRFAEKIEDEPGVQRRGQKRLMETLHIIDEQIGANKWVLGDCFSAADIYLYMLTTWLKAPRNHPKLSNFPNVQRIAQQTSTRPSVKSVYR